MGMYNEVHVNCPQCSAIIEFQTKSGSCQLRTFHIRNIPVEEFVGIIGDTEACPNCDVGVTITSPPRMNGMGQVSSTISSGEFTGGEYD